MQLLYDNITATLVAGAVMLILFAMQLRISDVSVQQTATYMAKKSALDFADWLEDDLLEIGDEVNPNVVPYQTPSVNSDSMTTTFQFFYYRFKSNGDTTRYDVRYIIGDDDANADQPAQTQEVDGRTIKLYRATRKVRTANPDGSSPTAWKTTGASAPLLRHFQILFLDRDGSKIANPVARYDDVWQTQVKFAMVPPFYSQTGTLRTMHWGANLMLQD